MPISTVRPARLVTIDVDGLRRDVFLRELAGGRLPNLGRLFGGPESAAALHLDPVSNAPSITFSCQSSIFTGAHPAQHGIMGNQFYDRFGRTAGGRPRHYAFDIGDTYAVDDAVGVFTGPVGLVNQTLSPDVQTLYERAAAHGLTSSVVNHMVARGATHWLPPRLLDVARVTKGGKLFGIRSAEFDADMIDRATGHLRSGHRPDLLTVYFLGLDHESHVHGPGAQAEYLAGTVDRLLGQLLDELQAQGLWAGTLFALVSDHGQIEVVRDDRHSLRLGFPFDREMGYLFDALHLDVHDKPGEAPNCDAVVATNGGAAFVYLQNRRGRWADPPRFEADVLPVARAFWEAHTTGRYAEDLRGALDLVLARDVEHDGWNAPYLVVASDGSFQSLEQGLAARSDLRLLEPLPRLRYVAGPTAGDLLLFSRLEDGFYFGGPITGVHGGLHPEDSQPVLSYGWPTAAPVDLAWLRETVQGAVAARCQAEDRQRPGVVDLVTGLTAVMGWA